MDVPDRPDQTVLVTGSSGMLGSALAADLTARGARAIGVDIRAPAAPARFVTHQADVRDTGTLTALLRDDRNDVDAVVHCAAALPSNSASEIASVDVDGTRSVLDAAAEAGVPRVVHVSSTAVYGLPDVCPTPETSPLVPVDSYNSAKIEAEELSVRSRADGLDVCILRPKTFLGPGRLGLFGMLFEWADEGRNFPVIGSGSIRCQMLDVEDLVGAIRAVLASDAAVFNSTYNLGATDFGTLRDDFQAVLDESSRGRRVVSLPQSAAVRVLCLLDRFGLSPVYRRLVHKLTADSFVDTSRAERAFGFRPRYSNEETLLRTFRWWQENQQAIRGMRAGTTHGSPWRQGALRLAKAAF